MVMYRVIGNMILFYYVIMIYLNYKHIVDKYVDELLIYDVVYFGKHFHSDLLNMALKFPAPKNYSFIVYIILMFVILAG